MGYEPAWKGDHGGGEETAAILGIDTSLVDEIKRIRTRKISYCFPCCISI